MHREAAVLRRGCSAMSIDDMIFRREMMPSWIAAIGLLHLVQHAVDAEPDGELMLAGLDVDVARTVVDGLRDQEVDEAHDGRVGILLLERSR